MSHAKFDYQSLQELQQDIEKRGLAIPIAATVELLGQPITIGSKTIPNRLSILPMEGCDGTADGKPDELTVRRYNRFAQGGAGLLWFEATAVVHEGRANPRQLQINEVTKDSLKAMLEEALLAAKAAGHKQPFTILQLTHSGRNSRPDGSPRQVIATRAAHLEDKLVEGYHMITDQELKELEDTYVHAAEMAAEAGFDAVDIKSSHGYLLAELLMAHTRKGIYGGSFENRTRLLCNIVEKIKSKVGDKLILAVRLGAYDSVPGGWGTDEKDYRKPDLTEPVKLIKILNSKGVALFNISAGNPYYNPHVTRPYDAGSYLPPTHPLEQVSTLLNATKVLQAAVPDAIVMGSGFTWLRQYAPYVAAGCIKAGWMKLAGFGRQAFAYPDFAKDILTTGKLDTGKLCLACSKCTAIMRDGGRSGCVPRDAQVYVPIYRQGREGKLPYESDHVAEHV